MSVTRISAVCFYYAKSELPYTIELDCILLSNPVLLPQQSSSIVNGFVYLEKSLE